MSDNVAHVVNLRHAQDSYTSGLNTEQYIWLQAWLAAIANGSIKPSLEARGCLNAFRKEFSRDKPKATKPVTF